MLCIKKVSITEYANLDAHHTTHFRLSLPAQTIR
jgi:hypothetical protein